MSVHRLTAEDHERVTAAVAAAESHTAGEIVTVVAERSDSYRDVQLAWAIVAAFVALAALAVFPAQYLGAIDRLLAGGWTHEWTPGEIFGVALAAAVCHFAAAWLLQLWRPLRFWLIPAPIKTDRTLDHAEDLFKVGAERRTHGRTGILIYVSLREHRAHIVADEAITGKVSPDTWGDAMAAMLAEIRRDRLADGMIAAVERVGAVLAKQFPRGENDTNELPDRLIEL